jgi:serine phosphatase RsbU (regulator of sigma subunit)
MYGSQRVDDLVHGWQSGPRGLIGTCLEDLTAFRKGVAASDDLTIMAIRRVDET